MDPERRKAARIATVVAVPLALAVALISLLVYDGFGSRTPDAPSTLNPPATAPVTMPALPLAADAVPVCRDVISHLPDSVAGRARRPVSDGAEQNAAYGDPPITLACGSSRPSIAPTADVYPLSGVCWYAEPRPDGAVWTTIDRQVPVTVTVPGPTDGSAQLVVPFSAAVAGGDPAMASVPAGCR